MSSSNSIVLRRLYRSLLYASKPFSSPHPNAAVNASLIHRTGIDDGLEWERVVKLMQESMEDPKKERMAAPTARKQRSAEQARDLSKSYADPETDTFDEDDFLGDMETSLEERKAPHRVLFRRLLRETVTGTNGMQQMLFPSQVDTDRLKEVLRREFRSTETPFDVETRQKVAFLALRELNTKLHWSESMQGGKQELSAEGIKRRNQRQAAKDVTPVSVKPSDYLQPGTFLVAHPFLTGYFRRTVICILDHSDRNNGTSGGTYGLVVNKQTVSSSTGRDQTLTDVLRTVPPQLAEAFGESLVREGGPVHMSIQMVHSAESPGFGGTVLPMRPPDDVTSTATWGDRAVWYQGDIIQAAEAVSNGQMDRDDVCFYVGASCWELQQLESEIERGYWLPCKGPPEIALTGKCEHNADGDDCCPTADLWLSMMCALGEEEANLAHLLYDDEQYDLARACDSF